MGIKVEHESFVQPDCLGWHITDGNIFRLSFFFDLFLCVCVAGLVDLYNVSIYVVIISKAFVLGMETFQPTISAIIP